MRRHAAGSGAERLLDFVLGDQVAAVSADGDLVAGWQLANWWCHDSIDFNCYKAIYTQKHKSGD